MAGDSGQGEALPTPGGGVAGLTWTLGLISGFLYLDSEQSSLPPVTTFLPRSGI